MADSKTEKFREFLWDKYETTISDGWRTVKGSGSTSEESQKRASEKWHESDSDTGEFWDPCYLTTACVDTMGLPNSCLELTVLRQFRDRVLLKDSFGKRAVREYYSLAPEILAAIRQDRQGTNILKGLYSEIRKAVDLVLAGDFHGAFTHYQQVTMGLKEKYLS